MTAWRGRTSSRRPPAYLRGLDPGVDFEAIYRHMVLREFWPEMRVGFNLAFYRTYGVPRIARLLLATGEITGRPFKRAYDTGLIMYELISNGLDSPRGSRVLARLDRMHRIHNIDNADYRYVLGALVFIPGRWIDRFGPRTLCDAEREATLHFYRRVGEAMHIRDVPATLAAFEAQFEEYERVNLAFDPAAAALIAATKSLMVQRLPGGPRRIPLARRGMEAITDVALDPPVRAALGIAQPPRPVEVAVHALLRLRGRARRFARVRDADAWTPGQPNKVYPAGYTLDDLGPVPVVPVRQRQLPG